jgi:diguanylate cyclase (GGDEF)-like protein
MFKGAVMAEKLLVIEDSKPIAKVIQQIAHALHYQVTVATSLAEVEKIFQTDTDFFAATIDFALPDAPDGEAIQCVLSHGIPGVVLTGKMDDATRQKILAMQVIDYIPKENSQAFLYLKRILHWQQTNREVGVLVVDDSSSARNHVVELLKRRNFSVYVANNGVQALAVMEQHRHIKMVLTDLEMPEMDGIALTNALRKKYSRDELSIIGISGASNGIHSARFIKNGADDFLRKPFCPEEFYCRVTQNIENLSNIALIQKSADYDYLTELANRRAFFDDAEHRMPQYIDKKIAFCLAMINLDYFRKVNDQYGYEGGDQVLQVVAQYLRKHFGSGLIGRLGGEEFSVLLPGRDEDFLYGKLDDFRRELAVSAIDIDGHHVSISASIGAVINNQESLARQLYLADNALHVAKDNGRNQLYVYGSDLD